MRPTFRAVAMTVVPDLRSADQGEWSEIEGEIERALAERAPAMRRQLVLFLRLLDWWARLRYSRRLTSLDGAKRTELLELLETHRLAALRRGIWGVRTLVFLGYYTRADVAEFIGYRAHKDGWSARPEARRERPSATPQDVGIVFKRPPPA